MKHQGTQTIETERLILRRYQMEDAPQMYQNWASDPAVTEFLTWPTHSSAEVSGRVMKMWMDSYDDPAYYNWGIVWKENGQVIGNIAAVNLNEDLEEVEIGYCLGRAWWGQQIMPEALEAVIRFFFTQVGANRVCAHHDSKNPKSGRVMQKAGMKQEGVLRAAARNNQGICDKVCYGILRGEEIGK